MADTRKIRIEFITGKPELTEEEKEAEREAKRKRKEEDEKKKEAKKKKNFIVSSAKKAGDLAWSAVKQSFERYANLTEDYILQNDVKILSNVVSNTKSLLTTLSVGSYFGPVGMAVSGTLWAAEKLISARGEYASLRQGINEANYNMQFQRVRMGLIDNGRGTEN